MKQSIYGIVGGLSSVIALDAFIRLIISIYFKTEIMFIGYSSFPGFWWPLFLVLSTAFTSFFGGMMAGSIGHKHIYGVIISYTLLLFILRVSQLQYLLNTESPFYASSALVLSMLGVVVSWMILRKNHKVADSSVDSSELNETDTNQEQGNN
jgi:hypothetical protein